MSEAGRQRVLALLVAARRIADPNDELGREARRTLPSSTGLSPENVELALRECLETSPSDAELEALCHAVSAAPAAHVLLSANAFVGAHRALALALASSARVFVRPSRREPEMAPLLVRAGAPCEIVETLTPAPGDSLWAYGTDQTLAEVRRTYGGVVLHAHGTGVGAAVIDCTAAEVPVAAADALAHDAILFDQRGCLSPRVAFVIGGPKAARSFARALALAFERWQARVPKGVLSADERADEERYRDSAAYAFELFPAAWAAVSLDVSGSGDVILPPIGRNLHVAAPLDVRGPLQRLRPVLTAVGVHGDEALKAELRALLPHARHSELGFMQRPLFDGPVDRRKA